MNMKLRTLIFLPPVLFLSAAWAGENDPGWRSDPQHPLLEYRFVCSRGAETGIWRNGYPGAVKLKARIRSSSYEGMEDVQIEPGSTAQSDIDTLYCGTFQVAIAQFSMAAPTTPHPGVPKLSSSAGVNAAVPAVVPGLLRFEPRTAPLPEITLEALASVRVGMKEAEVLQKLGEPLSRVSIPEEGRLNDSYRYNVAHDRIGVIQFANGAVIGIVTPK
jgi:hypothetical protein